MSCKPRDLNPYLFTLLPNTHFKMKQEIVINILRSTGIHFFSYSQKLWVLCEQTRHFIEVLMEGLSSHTFMSVTCTYRYMNM